MTQKTKHRIDLTLTYGLPALAVAFWPYVLGILIGLFAFIVVIGMAVRGFK